MSTKLRACDKHSFQQLTCAITIKDGELVDEGVLITEFAEVIRLQLEVEEFDFGEIDTLTSYKFSLCDLQSKIKECSNVTTEYTNVICKLSIVARST